MAAQDTVTLTRAQIEDLRAIIHNTDSPLGNRLQDVWARLYLALEGAAAPTPPAAIPATPSAGEWKCGNEFLPYHPSASHVNPDYRDGWNACYRLAVAQPIQAAHSSRVNRSVAVEVCAECDIANCHHIRARRAALTQPTTVQPLKDHEIAKLVNDLRDLAKEFHDHQSLRERIAHLVLPLAKPTTVQQARELTEDQIRDGFRDYDKELVARHRTAWQIWRDSSVWALKTAQTTALPGGNGEGES